MREDRTPPLADRIGVWTTPRRIPEDLLTEADPDVAFREAYAMLTTYRDIATLAVSQLARMTERCERLTADCRRLLAELREQQDA